MRHLRLLGLLGLLGGALALASCAPLKYEPRALDPEPMAKSFAAHRLADADLVALASRVPSEEGSEGAATASWDFAALTRVALAERPELEVARAELERATAGVTTAGARPNPTLHLDPEFVLDAESPWILGWALEIPLETGGRRGLRVQAAEARLCAEGYRLPLVAWKIRVEVRRALNELASARTEVAEVERLSALLAQRLSIQRGRLAAGAIDSIELGRAQQALAQADVQASDAREHETRAISALAVALGLPRAALESEPIDPGPQALPVPPHAEDARSLALANRLDLCAELADYAAVEADLRLEIARQYPNFSLAPGYTYDQGDHKIALGWTLELPLLNHNEGPIAEAEARRASSAARFMVLEHSLLGTVESARVAYAELLQRRERFRAAEELAAVEVGRIERAQAAGAVGRLALVEAELARLERERARAEAESRAAQALLELEDALQFPLAEESTLDSPRAVSP